jgi:hypothetical protein
MKTKSFSIVNYQLSILLLLAAIVAGCAKDSPVDNPDNSDKPAVVMQDAKVSGTVLDISGNPLSGVSVTSGTEKVTTGSDGAFAFTKAGTVNDRAVFKLEKAGYFTLTRSAVKDEQGEIAMQAMMHRKGNTSGISLQTDFDAGSDRTLQVGGMSVVLPAGSIVKADGSAYSGTVRADILYLAPDNENTSLLMPGGDLTVGKDKNSAEIMVPIGIADVELTDASDNPLNVKKEAGVEISFPVPSGATESSISHWTFSEGYGVWVEDGTLTKQGNVYKGVVNHFSPHGGGKKWESTVLLTQVVDCDKPQGGVKVDYIDWLDLDDENYNDIIISSSGVTNSAGYYSAKVRTYEEDIVIKNITVRATYNGKRQQQTVPASTDYGMQAVVLRFDDGCGDGEDGNITMSLRSGPTPNSFIRECNPAMPMNSYYGKRMYPNHYLTGSNQSCMMNGPEIPNGGLYFTETGGNTPAPCTGPYIEEGSWNTGFTEFTFYLEYSGNYKGCLWLGTVQLGEPYTDGILAANYMGYINFTSVTIRTNQPVSLEVRKPESCTP